MNLTALALAGLLTLGACATATDLREAGPASSFYVQTSPEAYRDCLYGLAPNALTVAPYGKGWVVSRIDIRPYLGFVEIMPEGEGARVSAYGARGMRRPVPQCM